jgi:hypothetical protein
VNFYLKFGFKSLIQNLFRILKSALHESCRELNFEQLLFWAKIVKTSFSSSNWNLNQIRKSVNLFRKRKAFFLP